MYYHLQTGGEQNGGTVNSTSINPTTNSTTGTGNNITPSVPTCMCIPQHIADQHFLIEFNDVCTMHINTQPFITAYSENYGLYTALSAGISFAQRKVRTSKIIEWLSKKKSRISSWYLNKFFRNEHFLTHFNLDAQLNDILSKTAANTNYATKAATIENAANNIHELFKLKFHPAGLPPISQDCIMFINCDTPNITFMGQDIDPPAPSMGMILLGTAMGALAVGTAYYFLRDADDLKQVVNYSNTVKQQKFN